MLFYKDSFGMEISTLVPVMELISEEEEALIGLYAMELISMEIDV